MKPSIKVIGVPDDINSSFMRGSKAAPPLIREALYSDSSNLFSESGLDCIKMISGRTLVISNFQVR